MGQRFAQQNVNQRIAPLPEQNSYALIKMGDEGLEHAPETAEELEFDSRAANALHSEFPEACQLVSVFALLPDRLRQRCRQRVRQIVIEFEKSLGESQQLR